MKTRAALLHWTFSAILFAAAGTTWADELNFSKIAVEEPPKHDSSSYDQLLTLQLGQFHPRSVQFNNGGYEFNYGNNVNSFLGEVGWAARVLDGPGSSFGSIYFEENVAFSTSSGDAVKRNAGANLNLSSSSYSLYLLGLDTRLMYAAKWFPVRWLIPFVDGGYQYSFYYQPSSSGIESAGGTAGNFVAGAGLRIWLNPKASINGGNTPIFVSAKYNRIFDSASSLNLGSTSIFGGMSLGF